MVGMVPSGSVTFDVAGDFNTPEPKEGKLYWHPKTQYLYYYSTTLKRSSPTTGYFPIWDGSRLYESSHSRKKKYPDDVLSNDPAALAAALDDTTANRVKYLQRRMDRDKILHPEIAPGDNMFTQCVKTVIQRMEITMVDLHDMAAGKLSEHVVDNYYSSLNSINMMRQEKWIVWMDVILKMTYSITVVEPPRTLLTYDSVEKKIDTGLIKWDSVIDPKDDPLKQIVKVLIQMKGITKTSLQREEVDYYAVNNLFTAIYGDKLLSAQLFSRFLRLADLSYSVMLYKDGEPYIQFKE